MGDADIDSFIAQQKAKLANERQALNDTTMNRDEYHEQWRRAHEGTPLPKLNLTIDLSPRTIPLEYEKDLERQKYKKDWFELVGKYMEPGSGRKQWDKPSNLSPRGPMSTDALINHVQREKAREEYQAQWRQLHKPKTDYQASPRAPVNTMTGPNIYNSDQLIQDIINEKKSQGDDSPRRRRADADSGLKNFNLSDAAPPMSMEEYRRDWQEKNKSYVQVSPRSQRQGGALLIRDDEKRVERLKKMEIDRNQEYNLHLAMKQGRGGQTGGRNQTDEYKAGALPGNESDNVKWQNRKKRNEEYNQYLASRNERDEHRFDDKKRGGQQQQQPGQMNSLPRLNYSTSAQRRQNEQIRNQEYNLHLAEKAQRQRGGGGGGAPPSNVRTGWGTPDYSDMLAKNRAKEQNFRRANDIAFEADPVARQNGPPSVRRAKDQGGEYFATLPLGRNTDSAQQRQKNQYSNDLKMQMAEAAQARQIERRDGLAVNNNSVAGQVAVARPTPRNVVDPYYAHLKDVHDYDQLSPRSNAILGRRQPTQERLKNRGGLNLPISTGADPGNGILDMGLFNQPRTTSLDPPAGLVYQPSTFITANAIPTLNNSVDEAYNFYASKNPLDLDLNTEPVPAAGGGQKSVPSLNLGGVGGGDQYGPSSKVRFQEQTRTPAQGMEFATDDDRKQGKKQSVSEYRAELERQMAEKNIKKQRAKEEQERYELKIEEEAKYYDPFGKGGGGAPMRDATGNVISDLRQIRSDNQNPQSYCAIAPPREVPTFTFDKSPRGGGNSYRDDLIGPPPPQTTADGDPSFARGGHGIFGMPKTDVEKMQADKYKLDLKRQIEEKKADDYRKKQLQQLEDEREQKILDEQRAKIQREYEEEQRKNNEKKEEARRKNEEMMRAADDKKRELERQRREEEDRRQEELREKRDREQQERQKEEEAKRGKSPPIPALRGAESSKEDGKKETDPKKSSRVAHSPPINAARAASPDPVSQPEPAPYDRAQSANVLNQLTRLRAELRKESDRVQTMLHDQEDDVQIYDPRQIQRPPPAPVVSTNKTNVDVFETAVQRNPVALRRTPNDRANSRAVEDFNALKHKLDTDSRKQFREMYPGEPLSGDALESQQAALLAQQEDRLRYMKDRRNLEDTSALRVAGRDTYSSSSQLHSNSAFVDVNGIGHFPDDFDDMPQHRNDSARHRRRTRIPSSPQIERITTPDFNSRATFGSQTSLNVDKMAKKNEDRLRKLRDLQGDDMSLYDPEDVLDRFMSKQGHNRAPSRNTLLDDTWMRAGSKRSEY